MVRIQHSVRSSKVASVLLECNAILFRPEDPFVYSSGITSPMYADLRQIMGTHTGRKAICAYFAEICRSLDFSLVAGTASAGIAHAAWLADHMELPMVYVRKKSKEYGVGKQIEGSFSNGQRVVLVEDTITSGGSSLRAVEALRAAGLEVVAILSIYSYGFAKAGKAFEDAGVIVHTLCSLEELLPLAVEMGRLSEQDKQVVLDWKSAHNT